MGVFTIAGQDEGFVDGPTNLARLRQPEAVTFDSSGAVIFSDWGNNATRRVASGTVTTVAVGSETGGFADGPVDLARFNAPTGVAVDPLGRI